MKNHRFDRYLYMGITAVLVLAAATAVIFLFLERKAILALGGRDHIDPDSNHLRSRGWRFYFHLYTTAESGLRASCWERK